MKRRLSAFLAAASLLCPGFARAHEFWIEPDSYSPDRDESVAIRAFVGDGEREELPRAPRHFLRFEAVSRNGEEPISGTVGAAPAGATTFESPGVVHVVYQSRHSYLELPGPEFEEYLSTEGLVGARRARHDHGHEYRRGRESFARYAKSLLRVENGATDGFDEELGLPIEVVATRDPFAWAPGEPLRFRVLFYGAPLEGARVKLIDLDDVSTHRHDVTDAEGHVSFVPPSDGRWLVAVVHMEPAPADIRGDWESFWGSLTFELGAGDPGARIAKQ